MTFFWTWASIVLQLFTLHKQTSHNVTLLELGWWRYFTSVSVFGIF